MKNFFLPFIIMFINYTYCQKLIVKSHKKRNKLEISLTILNTSKNEYTFYQPILDDFCNGIVSVSFKMDSEIIDFPCQDISQIDYITMNEKNIIRLKENETATLNYEIEVFQNLSKIREIKYQINYKDYEFRCNSCEKNFRQFKGVLLTDFTKIN